MVRIASVAVIHFDTNFLIQVMRLNYEMILWWSAEYNAYVVDVPELHGCTAHGATRQAAIHNAGAAIKFWIKTAKDDGLEIPAPRGRIDAVQS
jgi:predicted RNase H-like HicB family nuclease